MFKTIFLITAHSSLNLKIEHQLLSGSHLPQIYKILNITYDPTYNYNITDKTDEDIGFTHITPTLLTSRSDRHRRYTADACPSDSATSNKNGDNLIKTAKIRLSRPIWQDMFLENNKIKCIKPIPTSHYKLQQINREDIEMAMEAASLIIFPNTGPLNPINKESPPQPIEYSTIFIHNLSCLSYATQVCQVVSHILDVSMSTRSTHTKDIHQLLLDSHINPNNFNGNAQHLLKPVITEIISNIKHLIKLATSIKDADQSYTSLKELVNLQSIQNPIHLLHVLKLSLTDSDENLKPANHSGNFVELDQSFHGVYAKYESAILEIPDQMITFYDQKETAAIHSSFSDNDDFDIVHLKEAKQGFENCISLSSIWSKNTSSAHLNKGYNTKPYFGMDNPIKSFSSWWK
ncbi:unnamed protein product [Gordionus sp. m RMFG-2023]|uniref:uncharacterized protein LOC135924676 n=1 Tax=Gordionus sp. m RMFG-2023 TaxID=3053472 RepID=UPI0030E4BD67